MPQINQDVLYAILNGMGVPLPQFFKEDGTPVTMKGNTAPWFELKDSNIMQQIDAQRRYQKTIQTHAATVIPGGNNNVSGYIDTLGFDKIAVSSLNDAATTSGVNLHWSNDGASMHAVEVLIPTAITKEKSAITETKARFVRIQVTNGDGTVPHTFNAWAFLKV